jgi:iron complex transport system ATP-binding protein
MSNLLNASNVKFGYTAEKLLLNNFNFSLNKGDFAAIIGPSGAGKTTVFRILTGYSKLDSGTVTVKTKNIRKLHNIERSKIMAVVPQNVFSPMPYTVRQIVEMGRVASLSKFRAFNRKDLDCVMKALECVKMESFVHKLFNNLSGGEKQRVMIAMALAQEPEILLLDEPTASLDISLRTHLMKLLRNLNRDKGITVLVISHDIQLAAGFCSRLILIKNGSIVMDGKVNEVLKTELINSVYECDVEIVKLNGKTFISVDS